MSKEEERSHLNAREAQQVHLRLQGGQTGAREGPHLLSGACPGAEQRAPQILRAARDKVHTVGEKKPATQRIAARLGAGMEPGWLLLPRRALPGKAMLAPCTCQLAHSHAFLSLLWISPRILLLLTFSLSAFLWFPA